MNERIQKIVAALDAFEAEDKPRRAQIKAEHDARINAWREFNATKHWVPNLRVHDLGSSVADLAIAMEKRLGITTNGE
jgi:hypothetical protein